MRSCIIASFILLSVIACKNPQDIPSSVEEPAIPQNAPLHVPDGFSDQGMPEETILELINNGDHIDFMFHELPLSMNQTENSAIRTDMLYVSSTPIAGIPQGCVPMARKIYLGKGEIILEADLYFSQQCLFQVFIKDEKPLFGNLLTMEAVQFYGSLMEQAKTSMPAHLRDQYVNPLDN